MSLPVKIHSINALHLFTDITPQTASIKGSKKCKGFKLNSCIFCRQVEEPPFFFFFFFKDITCMVNFMTENMTPTKFFRYHSQTADFLAFLDNGFFYWTCYTVSVGISNLYRFIVLLMFFLLWNTVNTLSLKILRNCQF